MRSEEAPYQFTGDEASSAIDNQARSRLAAIVECSSDAIIGKTLDGIITDWNQAAERIFGYSAIEAVGQPISLIIPEDRLAEEETILQRIAAGERVNHFETIRCTKDGRLIPVSLTISPILDDSGVIIGASKIAKDITQQRQIHQELMDSEARYRAILENAVDAIITISDDGTISSFNPAAVKMFGYQVQEVVGKNVNLLMPQPFSDQHDRYLDEYLKTGSKKVIGIGREITGRRKDGTLFFAELAVSETYIANRRTFTGIVRDISERKRAQLDSERLLRLLNLANLLVRGPDDRITHWNRGAQKLYGYSAEEAIGRVSHELLKTQFPEPREVVLRRLWANGRWEGELVHTARDGRQVVVASEWTIFPAEPGQPSAILEANFDITGRKAAERAVGESEDRFRNLFSAMSEGFCLCEAVCDASGKAVDFIFLVVNPAYEKLIGKKAEQLIGRRVREILPNVENYWIEMLCTPALTGLPIRYSNYAREVDRYFDVYVYSPEKGKFAALSMDVTERRKAQEAADRHAEALSRSNVELERFAYVASHDLQEPLRTVSSFASLLRRRGAALDAEGKEYLQFITDGVARMETLIQDLLKYSRVDSHGAAFKPADCNEIVKSVVEDLRASIDSTHARVSVDELPHITCDASQMGQVFQNLLTNAIKFCPHRTPEIRISSREQSQEWVFCVQDNGIGIAREYFDRIFVIFQRLHTIEEYGGTGIGLAICKKIVERHGGKIWVESEPGRGSSFYFSVAKREDVQ
jgi:PAS domain S-box-containing protein